MSDAGGLAEAGSVVDRKEPDDSLLLMDIARAVLARKGGERWKVEPREFWCVLAPPENRMPGQGWKLHVSATPLAAPVVLARAAEVLVRAGCAFKFARSMDQLAQLVASDCDRGSGGKFLTAYPRDSEQFRRVAAELDLVTDGLPGPTILSDRSLRPGSLVYYRFGVFGASLELTNDGAFESMLTGPGCEVQKDERLAWFSPPPWAVSPLPELQPMAAVLAEAPAAVLVGDRFIVRGAIRHSYRGGVFRATDQRTGAEVILKQARPHVMSSLTGTDARDVLRQEASNMDLLDSLGLTPHKVALISHQENLFLAEELIPGVTLRAWTAERVVGQWQGRGAPINEVMTKARQLVELMAAIHRRDLVLRDFNPNNIMVLPDGQLRLVDLEHAAKVGSRVSRIFTRAYAGAEQVGAPRFGPAPSQQSDLFSLGATILHLASGIEPMLLDDEPVKRPAHERLGELVAVLGVRMAAVRHLGPLILGLMQDDPASRWSLSRALEYLAAHDGQAAVGERGSDRLATSVADRLISDGLRHVLHTMAPDGARLWAAGSFGDTTDPCNVQYGAGGVLAVLTRAALVLGDDHLREGAGSVAAWVQRRRLDIPRILPGLYFGRSGTAWSLYDAAQLLGDDAMATQAIDLAKQIPVEWPNPDICHGAAGAGMAQLHLWKATGDRDFETRSILAADCVLHAGIERNGQWMWPIPSTFSSSLAGLAHYGFAHGVAGAGAFLLYAALATGREEYLDAAVRAGGTLQSVAEIDGDAAWWPTGEENDTTPNRMRHWCSGSSGVGTFLIRLWSVTGEQRFRDLAEAAGAAISRDRWYSGTSACHGLSGDGEFLIDLADFTGEQRFHESASEIAAVIHARHAIRDGLMVLPDESGVDVTAGYNTGLSGAAAFLLRLRHGGRRWWMLDDLLVDVGFGAYAQAGGGRLAGTER